MAVEAIDAQLAKELGWGAETSANNWEPGQWANPPGAFDDDDDEPQTELPPPHIPTYDEMKRHPHYGQYFRGHKYQPFPAWVYHRTLPAVLINEWDPVTKLRKTAKGQHVPYVFQKPNMERCLAKLKALGPGWSPTPFKDADGNLIGVAMPMTGKTIPAETEGQRQTRFLQEMTHLMHGRENAGGSGKMDVAEVAAIIAAAMKMMEQGRPTPESTQVPVEPAEPVDPAPEWTQQAPAANDEIFGNLTVKDAEDAQGDIQRLALIELAEREGVKIDKRWSNERIKEHLGL